MKDLYEYVNISNIPLEKRLELSIKETKTLLKGVDPVGACATYSRHLFYYLSQNHIVSKIINTKDLGASYEHFLVLIPINDFEYYLVDLTYQQFKNDELFKILLEKGYEKVTDLNFYLYYSIVTGEQLDSSLKDIFLNKGKTR